MVVWKNYKIPRSVAHKSAKYMARIAENSFIWDSVSPAVRELLSSCFEFLFLTVLRQSDDSLNKLNKLNKRVHIGFSGKERKYIIFEYSSVKRISRKQFTFSHLQKFTPPVSAFMRAHPLSYTLTSKCFTLSQKKNNNSRLPIWTFGQLCLYIFYMKVTFLINHKLCLFLVHNLRRVASWRISRAGEWEIWS